MTNIKTRIPWIDVAKAIGIFFIVYGHAMRDGVVQQYIYSFHVPMFFILSGFTFRSDISLANFLKKRVRSILVPYLIASFLSVMAFALLGAFAGNKLGVEAEMPSLGMCLVSVLYGNSKFLTMKWNLPLWFLPCIFGVELVVLNVEKLLTKKSLKQYALKALFFMALGIVWTNFLPHIYLPWHLETGFSMIPFFLLGVAMQKYLPAFSAQTGKKRICTLCLGGMFIIFGGLLSMFNIPVNVQSDRYGIYPLFLANALMGCAGWIMISCGIGSWRLAEFVGKRTLPILLYHKFPILVFQVIIPVFSTWLTEYDSVKCIVAGIVAAVVSIAGCLVFGLIAERYIPIMIGKSKMKRIKEK